MVYLSGKSLNQFFLTPPIPNKKVEKWFKKWFKEILKCFK
jgi:hypothetical protein